VVVAVEEALILTGVLSSTPAIAALICSSPCRCHCRSNAARKNRQTTLESQRHFGFATSSPGSYGLKAGTQAPDEINTNLAPMHGSLDTHRHTPANSPFRRVSSPLLATARFWQATSWDSQALPAAMHRPCPLDHRRHPQASPRGLLAWTLTVKGHVQVLGLHCQLHPHHAFATLQLPSPRPPQPSAPLCWARQGVFYPRTTVAAHRHSQSPRFSSSCVAT
jgi:hypothetical protein